ncbi:MAG: alpha/beta hydrolase [Spirochaetes bacterium]|nr:alpha/beta hydrolase [Spirochaetota bacterium]
MERSGFLIKLTTMAVDSLIKFTNADIRTHGEENVPDQPVLYVVNHFTRMETFVIPYIIRKTSGKEVLSLAASEFFGGGFGNYLEKLGAVSTKSPDRDRVMTGALLKKDMACMIFPEGQMIKDKKLIEKGKFMVYNSGIRRPPHTGAALLALRSEFYREKLKYFVETGYKEGIKEICDYFGIDRKDLNTIINSETQILPVNITYYPLRARKNIINKLASKFVDKLPERLEEELEIEGTMLIDGVDIDINFGKPIPVNSFVKKKKILKSVRTRSINLKYKENKQENIFRKESTELMYQYMSSIYNMTTINHDHILSYILAKYKKNKVLKRDFRNRSFLLITMIKDQLKYNHTFLYRKQNSLLIDDDNDKVQNFLKALENDLIITVDNEYIYKNKKKFSRIYEFHTIRKDNIAEVLKNEIEPLKELTKTIDKIMRLPDSVIKKRIRKLFLKWDMELFQRDYEKYFIEGESKPKKIGQPFFLRKTFSNKGILLVHGYMSAPEEMRELGELLHSAGYNVYGVRLRGHGTAPEDLASRTWKDWFKSVRRGYIILTNTVDNMAIAGFSTGGGLALLHADDQGDYKCLISICAPLKLMNIASKFASTFVGWNKLLERMHVSKAKLEFVDNHPQNPHINYFRNPVNGVYELEKLMKETEHVLRNFTIPSLVIQGNNDPVVNPESGKEIFEKIGSEKKVFLPVDADKHVIVRDDYVKKIFPEIKEFLKKFL